MNDSGMNTRLASLMGTRDKRGINSTQCMIVVYNMEVYNRSNVRSDLKVISQVGKKSIETFDYRTKGDVVHFRKSV